MTIAPLLEFQQLPGHCPIRGRSYERDLGIGNAMSKYDCSRNVNGAFRILAKVDGTLSDCFPVDRG